MRHVKCSIRTSGSGFGKHTREAGWSFFSWAAAGVHNAQKHSLSPVSGPSPVLGPQLLAQADVSPVLTDIHQMSVGALLVLSICHVVHLHVMLVV